MTVTINGTTGIDKVQPGVVTSSSLASGQTLAVNGITFPATQSASSDANTLDDYEEGTWTPVASSASGSITSYTSAAIYTKVGRVVNVSGYVQLNNVGTAGASLLITNLPFSCANSAQPMGAARDDQVSGQVFSVFTNPATTTIYIQSLSGSAATWTNTYKYNFNLVYVTTT